MDILDLIEILEAAVEAGVNEVEIHFQPNYPLRGQLENARVLNGKLAIAAGAGDGYGDSAAWDEDDGFEG